MREEIGKALRSSDKIDERQEKEILKQAMTETLTQKKVGIEKLRKDITPAMKKEIFGKIYREELEHKKLSFSKLR